MPAEMGGGDGPKADDRKKEPSSSNTCLREYLQFVIINCMKTKQGGVYLTDANLSINKTMGAVLTTLYFLKL